MPSPKSKVKVFDALSIVLFVSVSVPATSETVPVASGNVIVLSAVGSVTVIVVSKSSAVAPSKTILLLPIVKSAPRDIVAVLIVGEVNVLLVSVCEPVNVATVLSIATEIWSSDTVVSIPVPPAKVRVPPVLNVSLEPESADNVNDEESVSNDKLPAPSVFKNWPAEPSACGWLRPSITTLPVPFGVILILPLVSVEDNVLPFKVRLSTFHTSILLLESTRTAASAVKVPCAWSIMSV